jgi:hypothetical protein
LSILLGKCLRTSLFTTRMNYDSKSWKTSKLNSTMCILIKSGKKRIKKMQKIKSQTRREPTLKRIF